MSKAGSDCAGSCRSLDFILNAVESHLIWEAVHQGRALTAVERMDFRRVKGEARRTVRRPLSVRDGGGLE